MPAATGSTSTSRKPGSRSDTERPDLVVGPPASFSPSTTTVRLDTVTTLKVRDNILIGTPPARFLRVKVIAAP